MHQPIITTLCLTTLLTLVGCASNRPQAHYTEQSGSGPDSTLEHMPGLIGTLRGHTSDSGLVLYSDNPKDHPLFHPKEEKEATTKPSQAAHNINNKATKATKVPTNSEIQEFKLYRSFMQFRSLPKNAPEKKRFREWLQWRRFEQTIKQRSGQHTQ